MKNSKRPFIVGIGGTAQPASSTEKALRISLAAAERAGADVRLIGGSLLCKMPHYLTENSRASPEALGMISALREADGVIIASPGYHGTVSGLVKNALDYVEEMSKDERAYFHGMPVGLISTAYGWQATASTLATLRTVAHALRGWPTPFGAAINTSGNIFADDGCKDLLVLEQLETSANKSSNSSICDRQ